MATGVNHIVTSGNALTLTAGNNNVVVAGTMINTSRSGVRSTGTADGVNVSVLADAAIVADHAWTAIRLTGDNIVVNNQGHVDGGLGIYTSGSNADVYNGGSVVSTSNFGAYTDQISGTDGFFANSGNVAGVLGVAMGGNAELINTGEIAAANIAVNFTDGALNMSILINSGMITSTSGQAVSGNAGIQEISNTGLILGDVQLFGGDDTYTGQADGLVTGVVYGGEGLDKLTGGTHADVLDGGTENDIIHGLKGDDTLIGGDGNDDIFGGDGNDEIDGNEGADVITGGAGIDDISGGKGSDVIRGNTGEDNLRGGNGDDVIRGGAGDDIINGEGGSDLLVGNGGADIFVFSDAADSTNNSDRDEIRYFEISDLIDLSGVIGGDAFTGTANEVRVKEGASNGNSTIYVDTDGDGTGDMRILVSDTLGLTASDFAL